MHDWWVYASGLLPVLILAFATWILSIRLKDVSIVDSVWSVFFLLASAMYAYFLEASGTTAVVLSCLVVLWSVRLCAYLTIRNWGKPEDRRYREIRYRNEPGFTLKSLYMIFGFQAILAWIISMPLFAIYSADMSPGPLMWTGAVLALFGIIFESVADAQLSRFTADPENKKQVLQHGLWRYSRHPNYFGESCVWWGIYLMAVDAGAWWSLHAPLLMTFLLLKFSGVILLEKSIGDRRPGYHEYIMRTSAFIPLPPSKH